MRGSATHHITWHCFFTRPRMGTAASSGTPSITAAMDTEPLIVMPKCDCTSAGIDEVVMRDNHANTPLLSTVVAVQKKLRDDRHKLGGASCDFPLLLSRVSNVCIEYIKFSTIMHRSKAEMFFNDVHYLVKSYFDFVHTAVEAIDTLAAQQHRVEWYNALAILCLCTDVNDSVGPAEFDIRDEREQATTREIMKTIVNERQDALLTHENAFTMFSLLMPTDEPTGSILQCIPTRVGQCILVLLSLMPCYYVMYTQAELAVATVIVVTKKFVRYDDLAQRAWSVGAIKGQPQGEGYSKLFDDKYIRTVRSIDANKSASKECEALWATAQSAAVEIERLLIAMVKSNEPQVDAVLKWFDTVTVGTSDRGFLRGVLTSL